jgi:hypothetical protein
MKLTQQTVKWFEKEQREHGTKTALYNLIWTIGADIFKMIGVKHIKTSDRPKK